MALTFDPNFYMTHRPDVLNAYIGSGAQPGTGLTWAEFAERHFNEHGWKEGANPNATFVTSEYLQTYTDIMQAGINPFQHYINHGVYEGRAPNASFPKLGVEFDAAKYLEANPDLEDAGISTPEQAYAHFVMHGQFEGRPGTPEVVVGEPGATFTLTPGADLAGTGSASNSGLPSNFRFTSKNEKIEGGPGTLSGTDVFIDETTTDNDELSVSLTAASGTFIAQNIETISAKFLGAAGQLQLDNVTGTKTVKVSGTTAGAISALDAQSADSPKIALDGYTNALTINAASLTGTTANNNAETINLEVSGATFGSTAATQTFVTINGPAAGVLENLNIKSTGSAANEFALVAGGNATFEKIKISGDEDLTLRVAHAVISGITVDASENTSDTTLLIERNGAAGTTNLTNVKGVETFAFRDANGAGDSLSATNVTSGSDIVVLSTFQNNGTVSIAGAAGRANDVLNLTLDHATANTSVSLAQTNIQDVETLNLTSNGNASANLAGGNSANLIGDFTEINISGDTSISLTINVDDPGSVRTTTINASGLTGTAAAAINAGGDGNANNRYSITGTERADNITGGAGNDTIDAGAGNDRIVTSSGADHITTGAGQDTIAFGAGGLDVDSVATVITDFTTGTGADRDIVEITAATGFGGVVNIVTNLVNNYIEGTAAGIAAASNSIMVITDTAFANFAAAEAALQAIQNVTDYAVLFLNSTTGFAELWVDADSNAAGNGVQLATFENITTLTGIASFDAANFTVV